MICLQKKTKEVLSLIVAHYQSLENDIRAQIQLEHDVEQEKIRKVLFLHFSLVSIYGCNQRQSPVTSL